MTGFAGADRVRALWSLCLRQGFVASIAIVAGIAATRLAIGGWESMSPDHARYVYSGMSLLADRGYVIEAGGPFLVRSPAYPVLVGGAFSLAGANGAHLIAWTLGVGGLLLAIAFAARLAGPVAAVAAALAVATTPLFWEQIVSIGIDMPQAALFLAALLLFLRPTARRWLAAGAVLGAAVLVKETVAPAAVLLPLAWLPRWSKLGWRRWGGLTLVFGSVIVIVTGWWWIYVWQETGLVFPLNALESIVRDEAPASVNPRPALVLAALVAIAAWARIIFGRWRDPGVRVLMAAALSVTPAVTAAIVLSQPVRNVAILALLSCVAIGVATADVRSWAWRRLPTPARRGIAAGFIATLIAAPAIGQSSVSSASEDPLPAQIAELLRPGLMPGEAVVSSFRYRSELGVELFENRVSVRLIPIAVVYRAGDPARFIWLGERRGTLFGLSRNGWERALGSRPAAYLAIAVPHPLSPAELLSALRSSAGWDAGLTHMAQLRGPTGMADVFEVNPARVEASGLRLHAQPGALIHWLDLADASGEPHAVGRLVEAHPVVPARSSGLAILADRLGSGACFRHEREGGSGVLLIEPVNGQADCMSASELSR
jgi:hypothetical protein